MDEDLARLRAEMDQSRETIKEIAGLLWSFYNGAIESGFTESQSFALSQTYLTSMVQGAAGSGESE